VFSPGIDTLARQTPDWICPRRQHGYITSEVSELEWRFESVGEIYPSSTLADIMALLRAQGASDSDFDSAELICVELFSNLIRHARGAVRIELDWSGEFPKLSIIDVQKRSAAAPIRLPADPLAESGRGLFIIKALAKDLRVSSTGGDGSVTCAALPVRRA
jgi:anti-sigma regulatory factor (Ser/Thr protein kinase)